MHPVPTSRYPSQTWISPALRGFVDEAGALAVRLMAYVGALGLIAITALRLFDGYADSVGPEIASQLSQLLPPAQSVQPAKPQVAASPGVPVVGVPNLFLRGSL
jgi:hypothetical protein